jgi:hypothetical protein
VGPRSGGNGRSAALASDQLHLIGTRGHALDEALSERVHLLLFGVNEEETCQIGSDRLGVEGVGLDVGRTEQTWDAQQVVSQCPSVLQSLLCGGVLLLHLSPVHRVR